MYKISVGRSANYTKAAKQITNPTLLLKIWEKTLVN